MRAEPGDEGDDELAKRCLEELVERALAAHLVGGAHRGRPEAVVPQHPLDPVPDPVERGDDPGARGRHARDVHRLVAEQRHAHERAARCERAERRPRPAVADDRGGVAEDRRLVDPSLDANVARDVSELDVVAARREEHPRRKVGDLLDGARVHLRGRRKRRGDAPEADVHERPVVSGPPVGQRGGHCPGSREAEARHGEGGGIHRRGKYVRYGDSTTRSKMPSRRSSITGPAIPSAPCST